MSHPKQPEFISIDDYLAGEELAETKSEYIDGWVRAMSGATIRHNSVQMNCSVILGSLLKGKPCRPFGSDMRLYINRHDSKRYYYPDLQVVCESNAPSDNFQDRPVLIIEVLSPATRSYDLDEKLNAYLKIPSLQCYVILEQHFPFAIVMRRTPDGFLRETHEGTDAAIEFPFIESAMLMSEIYDGIEFTSTCVQESEEAYDVS